MARWRDTLAPGLFNPPTNRECIQALRSVALAVKDAPLAMAAMKVLMAGAPSKGDVAEHLDRLKTLLDNSQHHPVHAVTEHLDHAWDAGLMPVEVPEGEAEGEAEAVPPGAM